MCARGSSDVLEQCGCRLTKCGLELPPSMPLEMWEVVGRALGEMDDKLRWCIGDWWAYGEHRYGDRHALVESDDWHGPSFQTCVNYGNVCQKFEGNRRRLLLGSPITLRLRICDRTKLTSCSTGAKKLVRQPANPGLRASFVMKCAAAA